MTSDVSVSEGPAGVDLIRRTIPDLADQRAAELPDKVAHVFLSPQHDENEPENHEAASNREVTFGDLERREVTFRDLSEKSLRLAGALLENGIKPGARLVLLGTNCPEWLYLELACMRLRVLLLKVSGHLTSTVHDVIREYQCVGLVVDNIQSLGKLSEGVLKNAQSVFVLRSCSKTASQRPTNLPSYANIADFIDWTGSSSNVRDIESSIDPMEPAYILGTSGSTGKPKFVQHSHVSTINGVIATHRILFGLADRSLKFAEGEVYFNDRSFSWIGAWPMCAIIFGLTMVHLDLSVSSDARRTPLTVEVLQQEKVTTAVAMPYLIHDFMMLSETRQFHLPDSLRVIFMGGESLPEKLVKFTITKLPTFYMLYGGTETMAVSYGTSQDAANGHLWMKPIANCRIKITDDSGDLVPYGTLGRVWVSCPFIMLGYMRQAMDEVDSEPIDWYELGDIGEMRADGAVRIIGRTKDVISRGAVKIQPGMFEEVLSKHPRVSQAVVLGVADPRLHQEICACVLPKPGAKVLQEELEVHLAKEMTLSDVRPKHYLILQDFPLLPTGKINKGKLLQMAESKFCI